jgi:hypothetical protein
LPVTYELETLRAASLPKELDGASGLECLRISDKHVGEGEKDKGLDRTEYHFDIIEE